MNIREAIRASGGLITLAEAGDRLGLSRERMQQYTKMGGFPEPLYERGTIRVFLGQEVEEWVREFRGSRLPHQAARATNERSLDDFRKEM